MRSLIPGFAIFISNIVLIFCSIILTHWSFSFAESVFALTIGNAIASAILKVYIFYSQSGDRVKANSIWSVVWALFYFLNYCFFCYAGRKGFSVSNFLLSEALAPVLTGLIWFAFGRINRKPTEIFFSFLSVALLLFLTWNEFPSSEIQLTKKFLIWTLVTVLLFSGSQLAAQRVSSEAGELAGCAQMTLLSSILFAVFVAILFVSSDHFENFNFKRAISFGVPLGGAILVIQVLYLFGLRRCTPLASVLIISTGVPLSILARYHYQLRNGNFIFNFCLSLGYCFWVFVIHLYLSKPLCISKKKG